MPSRFLASVAPGDSLPIYRQIIEQVKAAIAAGLLAPGDRLPSHRDLARDLVVAPLTVKRAYDVLEQEGVAHTKRGRGTFVEAPTETTDEDAQAELDARLAALVRHARVLGLTQADVIRQLRAAWRAPDTGRDSR